MNHPEWDLATYSGTDSDFWKVESPAAEETSAKGVVKETRSADGMVRETDMVVIDPLT